MLSLFSRSQLGILLVLLLNCSNLIAGTELDTSTLATPTVHPAVINKPMVTPTWPSLNAKAYLLLDVDSGRILAEKNSNEKLPPASLTKMMTLFVISNALQNGQLHLDDKVHISQDAWKTGGSRMFLKAGEEATVKDLLKGIIVDSGNDACVAMAEHLGGSEAGFTEIMNQQAQMLGMTDSHFTDSTGLPNADLYTTAKDLAILGRALVNTFPQYYHWYKQKWFTYNGIRQPNRNRLLWRNTQVDGIKTGHTNEAGFCLVSSAKRNDMRLLAVVLGSPSETIRADDSERLLNYGFRFYETHKLHAQRQTVTEIPIFKGAQDKLAVGLNEDHFVTIPNGLYAHLSVQQDIASPVQAPIQTGDKLGTMTVRLDDKLVSTRPLYALQTVPEGGFFTRAKDSIRMLVYRWTH